MSLSKTCEGKRRYTTRKYARRARNATPSVGHLSIYRCEFCDFYHLGHMPDDVRRGDTDKDLWLRRTGARA